jgi:hypothetical protein
MSEKLVSRTVVSDWRCGRLLVVFLRAIAGMLKPLY